jgi:hypothetical protein
MEELHGAGEEGFTLIELLVVVLSADLWPWRLEELLRAGAPSSTRSSPPGRSPER